MTRVMYDDISASGPPGDGALYAGYLDGAFQDYAQFQAKYPGKTVVGIAVFASDNRGIVLDVETGDATPVQAPGWVLARRAAGVDPSVYCNTSTWPDVRGAFRSAGVAEPHYWVAAYDGDPTIPMGAVAKQYQSFSNYDVSSVADYWPGVDPPPTVAVPPPPPVAQVVRRPVAFRFLRG